MEGDISSWEDRAEKLPAIEENGLALFERYQIGLKVFEEKISPIKIIKKKM
jgi:hypothetical protein